MGLILRLLQIVLISAQLLKAATTTVESTPKKQGSHSLVVSQIPPSNQSLQRTQSISATITATIIASLPAPSTLQSSSDNGNSPLTTPTTINTTSWKSSSVGAVSSASSSVQKALTSSSTSSTSLPDTASQPRASSNLSATESASDNRTGVPNETPPITSSYATSPTTLTNSGPATTQAVYFTSNPTIKESFTVPVAPTTIDSSPTQTTTISGLPASSNLQSSSGKRTSPSNEGSVTTTTPEVQNTLTSYSTSRMSLPESASQLRTSSGLIATKSNASSYLTGVPKQTLSINSSHATSPVTSTNSGPATNQAPHFTSDHSTKESSTNPVAPTTTDSSTKQTITTSGTEPLGMSIYTVLAGTLLHMSPNFFGG
ncbi:putative protein TPRXL isoform X2 [Stylophora pistillata]|uniref:putative protein TPRXL isoform X2 n=1 Tax=Stylophora pistillata TaxID=50429 RepID=UPI000C045EE1|nr:putative protein TPRXL isoform X2 [Stylophora pistillata]